MVCKTDLLRCQKKVCAKAKLPAGFKPNGVRWSPHDPSRVVATGSKQALWSEDGGKTFSLATGAPSYTQRIAFDPRKGTKNVYLHAGSGSKVYRSLDGGKSYHDVTPPSNLKPPAGTYVRDIAVAADGALIGLAHPGVIRLAAP